MSNGKPIHIRLLGHEFRAMTAAHYEGLAGAPDDSYVYEGNDGTTLVASPVGTTDSGHVRYEVTELSADGEREQVWSAREVR